MKKKVFPSPFLCLHSFAINSAAPLPCAHRRAPLAVNVLPAAYRVRLPSPAIQRSASSRQRPHPFPLCAFPISAVFCKTPANPHHHPCASASTIFNSTTPL